MSGATSRLGASRASSSLGRRVGYSARSSSSSSRSSSYSSGSSSRNSYSSGARSGSYSSGSRSGSSVFNPAISSGTAYRGSSSMYSAGQYRGSSYGDYYHSKPAGGQVTVPLCEYRRSVTGRQQGRGSPGRPRCGGAGWGSGHGHLPGLQVTCQRGGECRRRERTGKSVSLECEGGCGGGATCMAGLCVCPQGAWHPDSCCPSLLAWCPLGPLLSADPHHRPGGVQGPVPHHTASLSGSREECVCLPQLHQGSSLQLFPLLPPLPSHSECQDRDFNLVCSNTTKLCQCREATQWSKRSVSLRVIALLLPLLVILLLLPLQPGQVSSQPGGRL